VPGETSEEIGFASKKTVESVKSTERIMEAIDLWRTEKDKIVVCLFGDERALCSCVRSYTPSLCRVLWGIFYVISLVGILNQQYTDSLKTCFCVASLEYSTTHPTVHICVTCLNSILCIPV